MCAIPQLVSAPLNPIPIAEHFRRLIKLWKEYVLYLSHRLMSLAF